MPKVNVTLQLPDATDILPPSAPPAPVAANLALKLPVFWLKAAEVQFAQADAQFAIKTISVSKTKFYHAVASLPQDVASQILSELLQLEILTKF